MSFIETSAFDASNVEQAFHKILTGFILFLNNDSSLLEILRVASNKSLETGDTNAQKIGPSATIQLAPTTDTSQV